VVYLLAVLLVASVWGAWLGLATAVGSAHTHRPPPPPRGLGRLAEPPPTRLLRRLPDVDVRIVADRPQGA
jgi:hypothetical protein